MTSLTSMAMHSDDLCHDPHRAEKCDGKGHFSSHCFELFKNPPPKKSPQERKKEGDLSFCAVAIDSKAQPCKISVEVGGGTRQQRAFFTTAKPKRDHCPLPVSPTHTMGSAQHSRCTLKPAELCDDEVKDMRSVSPPPATTWLFPPSDDVQINHLRVQAAEAQGVNAEHVLRFLIRRTVCDMRVINWSICSRETLCWFLKLDRRGLFVETTAVQFPACWRGGC